MDNQHRKIKGYRELSAAEIDLMNRIKEKGAELMALCDEVRSGLDTHSTAIRESDNAAEIYRFDAATPHRWANIARTDIQTGVMALVRAIAQPEGV